MYQSKIAAHDITERQNYKLIKELENANWNALQEQIRVIVDSNMFLLDGGYSITVSYHRSNY